MYIVGDLLEELEAQNEVKVACCPECKSTFVSENTRYTRKVKQDKSQGGEIAEEEVVQLHCKRCRKLFTLLPGNCFKYLRYEKDVVLETQNLIVKGGTTPGYAASHVSKGTSWLMHQTTPMRWTQELSEKNPILILNRKAGAHLSGVLCLDEVYYRVNGKKACTLAAVDPNGNWLVHLKQVKGRDKATIKEFLQEIKETYPEEEIMFFVTDGYNGYIEPMKEVFPNAKRQLCKFHVMMDINKEISRYRRREKKKAEKQIEQSVKEISKEAAREEKKELKEIAQNLLVPLLLSIILHHSNQAAMRDKVEYQPTCLAFFAPLMTKRPHINFLDYYDRYYQGKINGKNIWPEDKMLISMSCADFKTALSNLEKSPHGSFHPNLSPQKNSTCANGKFHLKIY